MKYSYNWLKSYVPGAPEAEKLADIFTYHLFEVESLETLPSGDKVFDIKILPNRAHDLLSHQGLARELASLLNIEFKDPTPMYKVPEPKPTQLKINIQTIKDRRHVGRVVRNVTVGPSPQWVVDHLAAMGQRSINNIVDATNIVMFDCGQPTHAFDLNKVAGLELNIRDAKDGEKVTLLAGEEKELKEGMLAICDGAGNILDTGIKGGKHAEITTATTDLILEADNFDPVFARKTGQALNILTDARKRFENDLSPELAPYAMLELSALIAEMCPNAVFEEIVDTYPQKQEVKKLSFSAARIASILGLEVSVIEIGNILERYKIGYKNEGDNFEIVVPPMRLDLTMEEDIADEIARIIGYDKIKPIIPKIDFKPKVNDTYQKISWARNKLLEEGYSEVMTYAFASKGEVEVMQSASDKKFMRTNLSDGLKESLKLNQTNAPLLGASTTKVFEIGTVFKKDIEEIHVVHGSKKEIKEMSLDEFCKDMPTGYKLEPRNYNPETKFAMWSLFPFIARDVAVWVSEGVMSDQVQKVIKENAGELVVRGPELFDEFKKEGKVSYAFRLVFQSYERTLTDAEINEAMVNINSNIVENGWQVR